MEQIVKIVFVPLVSDARPSTHSVVVDANQNKEMFLLDKMEAVRDKMAANTTLLLGWLDKDRVFREYEEKTMTSMLGDRETYNIIIVLEVPFPRSPACVDVLVSVGFPQLLCDVTRHRWCPPVAVRLYRTCNYDQLYNAVLGRLALFCPALENNQKSGSDANTGEPHCRNIVAINGQDVDAAVLPWWVWTDDQDQCERQVRESWICDKNNYSVVEKGRNPSCNWVWGNKNYYFRLHRVDCPDEHMPNTGLPLTGWKDGLNYLRLVFHPLYARKALGLLQHWLPMSRET